MVQCIIRTCIIRTCTIIHTTLITLMVITRTVVTIHTIIITTMAIMDIIMEPGTEREPGTEWAGKMMLEGPSETLLLDGPSRSFYLAGTSPFIDMKKIVALKYMIETINFANYNYI